MAEDYFLKKFRKLPKFMKVWETQKSTVEKICVQKHALPRKTEKNVTE